MITILGHGLRNRTPKLNVDLGKVSEAFEQVSNNPFSVRIAREAVGAAIDELGKHAYIVPLLTKRVRVKDREGGLLEYAREPVIVMQGWPAFSDSITSYDPEREPYGIRIVRGLFSKDLHHTQFLNQQGRDTALYDLEQGVQMCSRRGD